MPSDNETKLLRRLLLDLHDIEDDVIAAKAAVAEANARLAEVSEMVNDAERVRSERQLRLSVLVARQIDINNVIDSLEDIDVSKIGLGFAQVAEGVATATRFNKE